MSDPGSLERYCSSYYDRHGLYNDGFPCPTDKYCCENADGNKKCCVISRQAAAPESSTLLSAMQVSSPATLRNRANKEVTKLHRQADFNHGFTSSDAASYLTSK